MLMFSNELQIRKFNRIPPSKPQANCMLPIIALAVPARAPCSDMARAIALGPVKPIPETAKNMPIKTTHNGLVAINPETNKIVAPISCNMPPIFSRRITEKCCANRLFKVDSSIIPKAFSPKA